MSIPRVTVALVALATAACAYDWTVGGAPGADSGTPDATVQDAGVDAGTDATIAADVSSEADVGSDGASPVDAAPTCAELAATLFQTQFAAKKCVSPTSGQCTDSLTNECNCISYVADAGSAAAIAYADALGQFGDAGCAAVWCDGSCVSPVGACYINTGPGHCFP